MASAMSFVWLSPVNSTVALCEIKLITTFLIQSLFWSSSLIVLTQEAHVMPPTARDARHVSASAPLSTTTNDGSSVLTFLYSSFEDPTLELQAISVSVLPLLITAVSTSFSGSLCAAPFPTYPN